MSAVLCSCQSCARPHELVASMSSLDSCYVLLLLLESKWRCPLGKILSIYETPECSHALENVTRACISKCGGLCAWVTSILVEPSLQGHSKEKVSVSFYVKESLNLLRCRHLPVCGPKRSQVCLSPGDKFCSTTVDSEDFSCVAGVRQRCSSNQSPVKGR